MDIPINDEDINIDAQIKKLNPTESEDEQEFVVVNKPSHRSRRMTTKSNKS